MQELKLKKRIPIRQFLLELPLALASGLNIDDVRGL